MSQFWHAHWAEDAFKPVRLGNWQVPNWHPKFPCRRHCVTTTFLADRSGRLLPEQPRSKRSPWGDFKGTWELPLKIDRKLAWKLSATRNYKFAAWEAHKIYYQGSCGTNLTSLRKTERKTPGKQVKKQVTKSKKTGTTSHRIEERHLKTTKKPEKNIAQKKPSQNVDRAEHKEDEKMVDNEDREELKKDEEIVEQEQKLDNKDPGEHSEDAKSVAQDEQLVDRVEAKEQQPLEKLYPQGQKEKIKSKCFCAYKSDSRLPVELIPKATRKNICTIHQRLRV